VAKARPVPAAETAAALPLARGTSIALVVPPTNVTPDITKTAGQEAPDGQMLPPAPAIAQLMTAKSGARGVSSNHLGLRILAPISLLASDGFMRLGAGRPRANRGIWPSKFAGPRIS
jgi:hypothetical protein